MHETGLVRAAVETAAAAAERAGGPVRSVRLGLGVTDELSPDSVRTLFAAIGAGSACEGAAVHVDRLGPTNVCAGCGRPVTDGECEVCGTAETRFAVPAGLSVLEITLDD
jgi:Zn finger protein HypA/HybF involved in hydrogenase expression